MTGKELTWFYGWLKDELMDSIGTDAYRQLFKDNHTYYGYPMGAGA